MTDKLRLENKRLKSGDRQTINKQAGMIVRVAETGKLKVYNDASWADMPGPACISSDDEG